MHLLYARFFTMALHDMGFVDFDEPFSSLVHQGVILGPDGQRMSKSHGNVISPDEYIAQYGSDVLRTYLAFGFSYVEGGPWNHNGIRSVSRFLERFERIVLRLLAVSGRSDEGKKEIRYAENYAIRHVSADIENFQFNTAVARMMELTNAAAKYLDAAPDQDICAALARTMIRLIAPFAPHFAEELWEQAGEAYSVFNAPFPECDESALALDTVEMVLQVGGKVRARFNVAADATKEDIERQIMATPALTACFEGKPVLKMIIEPGRIANVVVG
jgi:leucyl-tRNA synthetase